MSGQNLEPTHTSKVACQVYTSFSLGTLGQWNVGESWSARFITTEAGRHLRLTSLKATEQREIILTHPSMKWANYPTATLVVGSPQRRIIEMGWEKYLYELRTGLFVQKFSFTSPSTIVAPAPFFIYGASQPGDTIDMELVSICD